MHKAVKILYIDDDPDDTELFSKAVAEIDPSAEVVVMIGGVAALVYLLSAKESNTLPDLVLIDLMMPVFGGKETLTLIKADPGLSNLRVAMFTTAISSRELQHYEDYGVKVYKKPGTFSLLRTQVKDFLALYKAK